MNPLTQSKKTTIRPLFIALVLVCFGLSPVARAVVPAPDGGYPGNNTAEGTNALHSLTTGINNTAVGANALSKTTNGSYNAAFGSRALENNVHGLFNMAVGTQALFKNTADANMAVGFRVLYNNTTGNNLTGIGTGALFNNTTGNNNTAIGSGALSANTTGATNTAIGRQALFSNIGGQFNTAVGYQALWKNTTGNANTAHGFLTLNSNTSGSSNTALGFNAGSSISTANNVIAIGTSGANVSNSCFISNIRGVTTENANAIPVLIDSFGQLGTASSSHRFKNEIEAMEQASEAILSLKPVTFHYKSDSTRTPQFGLIAEEVAKVNPDLVVRDENGEVYTVRYDAVNAMLLNEFLKEHRKVEKLEATIAQQRKDFEATTAQQQKRMEALTARLEEQAVQIQKVSAQLDVSNTAPQIVLNNQ